MSGGFQTSVNTQPAPAVAGDWASTNPRFNYDAGPGGLVAGAGGITIGRFCWALPAPTDANYAPQQVVNSGGGSVAGIVRRGQQGLITTYLADASMVVPAGFGVSVCTGGDLWVKNDGTTQALLGQKAYAAIGTGKVSFAATGAAGTATGTLSTISAQTASVTGSLNGNVLTISAVGSGTLYAGGVISGTVGGSGIAVNTTIVSQVSGTVGGVGVYLVTPGEQSVGSGTLAETYGLLTVGGTVSGTFGAGALLGGTGVAAASTITALGTGVGGAGTYITQTQAMSSSSVTGTTTVETKWFATSSGIAGELVKISSYVLG